MTTFRITLSPQRRDDRLNLEKRGDTLLFNGVVFDPSAFGESTHENQWVVGQPEAFDGGWSISVILPHGSPAPRATRFPAPITVSADGPVELPPYEGPDEDKEKLRAAIVTELSNRKENEVTANHKLNVPNRLTLAEMPEGVYFSETASPFGKFPEYGAVVAHVIATASLLDLEMLRPAVSQHGSEALLAYRTAFAVLKTDEKKRRNFVKRMAENTGRERVWKTISWAYEFSKPVFEIRNAFAHHIWGECPEISNALLLVEPMDRLVGQAAFSQLFGHQQSFEDSQTLFRIAHGEGGSKLSEVDRKAVLEIVAARQNHPGRIEAFDMTFDNPLDVRAPTAEIWTKYDFRNAALAANMARTHVLGRLQQISRWLNGLLAEDELEPLPPEPQESRKR